MNKLDVLRDEYPGDDAWQRFVNVFRPAMAQRLDKENLTPPMGDEDFAIVLAGLMGDISTKWLVSPIEALGKRSPSDVFTNEPSGRIILRTLLMRMPQ